MTWQTPYTWIVGGAIVAMIALTLTPVICNAAKQYWKHCAGLGVLTLGVMIAVGGKIYPTVAWDYGIADNGSVCWPTNAAPTSVKFKWKKTAVLLPNSQPLYISSKPKLFGSEWTLRATTTVGALEYQLTIDDPTNQQYRVWHAWVPPSPVHTNGVWLGEVLEKAKKSGIEKMIIINGFIEEDGEKIAPKKEEGK